MLQPLRTQTLVIVGAASLLFLVSQASGKPIAWMDDLDQAARAAAQFKKPLLVKVSTTWCGPCRRMQRDTFSDERLAAHVNQCFIPVRLDGDRDSALVRRMGVSSYPSTLIVSSNLKVLKRITGYRTPIQLSEDLEGLCHEPPGTASSGAPRPLATGAQPNSPFADWCPVSPVVDGEFVKGQSGVTAVFRGCEIRFRDELQRRRFFDDPRRYWPVADGQCVVSWFDERVRRQGKMQVGLQYQGAIWFFASDVHRSRFAANPARYARMLSEHGGSDQALQ
jgi:YHS domain-containing protein